MELGRESFDWNQELKSALDKHKFSFVLLHWVIDCYFIQVAKEYFYTAARCGLCQLPVPSCCVDIL